MNCQPLIQIIESSNQISTRRRQKSLNEAQTLWLGSLQPKEASWIEWLGLSGCNRCWYATVSLDPRLNKEGKSGILFFSAEIKSMNLFCLRSEPGFFTGFLCKLRKKVWHSLPSPMPSWGFLIDQESGANLGQELASWELVASRCCWSTKQRISSQSRSIWSSCWIRESQILGEILIFFRSERSKKRASAAATANFRSYQIQTWNHQTFITDHMIADGYLKLFKTNSVIIHPMHPVGVNETYGDLGKNH